MESYGWTWEYIDDHMTVPRMKSIAKIQQGRPPQYIAIGHIRAMLAGYFGIKLDGDSTPAQDRQADGRAEDGTTLFDIFPS